MRLNNVVLIAFICLSACNSKESHLPISEYEQFGNQLATHFRNEHYDKISAHYRLWSAYDSVLQVYKSAGSSPGNAEERIIRKALIDRFDAFIRVTGQAFAKGIVVFSKAYFENEQPHVVIAFYKDGSYNFLDFTVITLEERLYISDCYMYLPGQSFSAFFVENELRSIIKNNLGDWGYHEAMGSLTAAQGYARQGRYESAWRVFNDISPEFQSRKNFQMTKMIISRHLADTLFLDTIEEFIHANYDDDRFRIAHSSLYYHVTGNLDELRPTLDSLSSLVGENDVLARLRLGIEGRK